MNEHDILDMIGDAKGSFVWDAQQVRSGEKAATQRKRLSMGRIWLIAAAAAVMLFGCAVAYVLSLQDLKVGESEENTIDLITLQNVNQDALKEWLAFRENYDKDGSLLAANENNESGIPDSYRLIYHCYTWDMVAKLDEIAEKYHLQLLSGDVDLQHYEHQVLYEALGIDSLFVEDAPVNVEYGSSYFYPEGTFDADFLLSLRDDPMYKDLPVSMRYSLKSYFDPVYGSLGGSIQDYEQWNYTRSDGTVLLMAMNGESARIYADLPEAFVSITMDFSDRFPRVTKELLEEMAEYFDLSIQPQPADMERVEGLLEKAREDYETSQSAKQEELYSNGYAAYVKQELERIANSNYPNTVRYMTYTFYDIDGDGTEELITRTHGFLSAIVSVKDGKSFLYYAPTNLPAMPVFHMCEENVFEIYDPFSGSHYYFKADADGPSFIVGLVTSEDLWFRTYDIPTGDKYTWDLGNITEEEVTRIVASYHRIELEWSPISEFPMN